MNSSRITAATIVVTLALSGFTGCADDGQALVGRPGPGGQDNGERAGSANGGNDVSGAPSGAAAPGTGSGSGMATGGGTGAGTESGGGPIVKANTATMLVFDSPPGNIARGTGSGSVHAAITSMGSDKYLLEWTQSNTTNQGEGEGRWDGMAAIVTLNVDGPPTVGTPTKINKWGNVGNRPFQRSRVACDGNGTCISNFASTVIDNDNPQEYVAVVAKNYQLTPFGVNDIVDIDAETNNLNHGASNIYHVEGNKFAGCFDRNNDNAQCYGLTLGADGRPRLDWRTQLFDANQPRPEAVILKDKGVMVMVQSVGNNRPPEYGVGGAVLDLNTGKVLAKQLIAKSEPGKGLYYNQGSLVDMGNGIVAVSAVASDGRGKNNNRKGSNVNQLFTVNAGTLAVLDKTPITDTVAPYSRHASIFGMAYGADGTRVLGAAGGASVGSGGAAMRIVRVDAAGKITVEKENTIAMSHSSDMTRLPNLGMRNPNVQGRDFLAPLGNVPNPGFGKPNGWMPEIKTFALAPVNGMKVGNSDPRARLALHLNVIPASWKEGVVVVNGGAKEAFAIPAGPLPQTNDPSGTGSAGKGAAGTKGGSGDPNDPTRPDFGSTSGCSAAPSSTDASSLAALAVIALVGMRRSRRHPKEG